jgi:hypothetical protein
VLARVGPVAYRLELPTTLAVHPVFHVTLVKAYPPDGPSGATPPVIAGDDLPEVHRLKHHRERTRGTRVTKEYLVVWSGCGPDHTSWVPEQFLPAEAISQYWPELSARQQAA